MKRYPFGALEVLARCESPRVLAERLGVNERQVFRWRVYGVTEEQADRLAVAVGFHPWSIWPELADDGTVDGRARWAREKYQTDPAFREKKLAGARAYYAENGAYVRGRVSRYERANREQINARRRRVYQLRKETSDA